MSLRWKLAQTAYCESIFTWEDKQVQFSVHCDSLAYKACHTLPGLDIESCPLHQTETDVWELHNSRGIAAVLGRRANAKSPANLLWTLYHWTVFTPGCFEPVKKNTMTKIFILCFLLLSQVMCLLVYNYYRIKSNQSTSLHIHVNVTNIYSFIYLVSYYYYYSSLV